MLRLVTFFVIVAALAIGAAWLADRPGVISLSWQGYAIELSLMTAAILLIAIVAIVVFLRDLYRVVVRSPSMVGDFVRGRRRDRGYEALSKGMLAVGSGDTAGARKLAAEAARLLPHEPMTKLLDAQAAQAAGRRTDAAATFNTMLAAPETKLLGLRGLFLEAKRDTNVEAARQYAAEALSIAPGVPWAGTAMFDFQCAAGEWDEALGTLQILTERKLGDKATTRRRRAVLLTAKAMESEDGEPDRALSLALEAHGLAPDLIAAAVIGARLSARLGNIRRAANLIEQTWRQKPHPELAEAYARVRPGDSVRDRYRRIKSLTQKAPHRQESRIALATAAIDAQDWAVARETLLGLAKTNPTVRICRLMAAVEAGEFDDEGRAREWLARSVNALPDPAWTADGQVSETWLPTSPVTGKLDAFEWKVPVETLTPLTETAIEALASPIPEPVALEPREIAEPADAVEPEPVTDTVEEVPAAQAETPANDDAEEAPTPEPATEADTEESAATSDAVTETVEAAQDTVPTDETATDASESVPEPPVDVPHKEESATITPIRPPDDPGPSGDIGIEEETTQKRAGPRPR